MEKEKLEEQIAEILGLEMAAQKAVEELSSKGLLDKEGLKDKLQGMKSEAGDHQRRNEQVMQSVTESDGLDQRSIRENAQEISQKASQMMQTYLGEDPDTLDALEFLWLAEGGEVTRYEVLDELAKNVKDKKLASEVTSILEEEKRHLELCIPLTRENSSG